jgi:hypothetical protein
MSLLRRVEGCGNMLIGFEAAARPTAWKSHIELEGCSRPGFVPAAALYANALPLENVRYAYQLEARSVQPTTIET